MRLDLTGRHIDITAGIRRVIETKLAKLERMLNDAAVSAQVVVSREKSGHRADVTLHARGEKFLHGNGKSESLGTAMGEAVDKLVQQARTLKGKYEERKRRAAKSAAGLFGAESAQVLPEPTRGRRTRVQAPRVIKSRQTVRTLSIGEAAALVGSGNAPVIFLYAATLRVAVLYRAEGGDLTLIETRA